MAATFNRLTAEEFFRIGDRGQPSELVRGEIVRLTSTGVRHGMICANIGFELKLYLQQQPLGVVASNDPGIITHRNPDSVRGPDVAYISYSRLPKGTAPVGFCAIPPEIVFEVKSPSDR